MKLRRFAFSHNIFHSAQLFSLYRFSTLRTCGALSRIYAEKTQISVVSVNSGTNILIHLFLTIGVKHRCYTSLFLTDWTEIDHNSGSKYCAKSSCDISWYLTAITTLGNPRQTISRGCPHAKPWLLHLSDNLVNFFIQSSLTIDNQPDIRGHGSHHLLNGQYSTAIHIDGQVESNSPNLSHHFITADTAT